MTKNTINMFEEGKTYLANDGSAWTFVKRNPRSVVWVNADGKHLLRGKPSKGYISVAIVMNDNGEVDELVVLPKDTKLSLVASTAEEVEGFAVPAKPERKKAAPKAKKEKKAKKSKKVDAETENKLVTAAVMAVNENGEVEDVEDDIEDDIEEVEGSVNAEYLDREVVA